MGTKSDYSITAQFKLYYQAGIDDTKQLLAQAGETLIPAIQQMLEVYDPKPLSAEEVLKVISAHRTACMAV